MKKARSVPSILSELNGHVESYLIDNNLKVRKGTSPGLWLCFVLPTSVIFSTWNYPDCSHFYHSATCLSIGLLLNSLTIIFQINNSIYFHTVCCGINLITTTLLLNFFTENSLFINVLFGVLSSFGFNKLLLLLLQASPETFTFGEAVVVIEAAILFFSSVIETLFFFTPITCIDISTKILQVGITGLAIFSTCIYTFPQLRNTVEFYTTLGFVILVIIILLHYLLGFSAVLWLFNLATGDALSIKLLCSWIVLTGLAVLAAMTQVKGGQKASTVVRKYFHVLALFVYLPGLLLKPCFLYLASGILFALFLGLEIVRVLKLPPIASVLDSVFLVFSDEKDNTLALTPIYLLVGCSIPLWLHPSPTPTPDVLLALLAGISSVAIGDTAASICGSWCGRHQWPDSKKTKEGSAACFISQLFFIIAMIHFGYVPRNNLLQPIIAIAVVTIVEATTDQIDNLALPLLMYTLLL